MLHRNVDRIVLMADGRIAADMTPDELLKSDLLQKHGIREPLYVTAMKYAGCELEGTENLGDINTIRFTDEAKGKLMRFFTEESEPMPENTADVLRHFAYGQRVFNFLLYSVLYYHLVRVLHNVAHALAYFLYGKALRVLPVYAHRAALWPRNAAYQLCRGGFTSAVFAYHGYAFAPLY